MLVPLIPVLGLCVWQTVAPTYTNSPPIRSDGLGYYSWTAAILHGNFDFCEWSAQLNPVDALSGNNPGHLNRCENKYPPGLAVLRFPVMGPVAAIANHGSAAQLTVTPAEEKASQWLSVLALLMTVGFMHATIRRLGVNALIADGVVLAATFGTGLFHYATYDGSFTHIYSAALFAGLLNVGVRSVQRGRPPNPVLVFFLALFIVLIREPDVLPLLAVVGGWLLWWRQSLEGAVRRRGTIGVVVAVLAAIVAVVLFQVGYNRWSAGVWAFSSYGQEPFSLTEGEELNVLVSYTHGLFSWYPVLFIAIALSLWKRAARGWGMVALAVVILLTIVYGSWSPWFLGGAMGMRGFVDVIPVIAVAGAVGVSSLSVRGRWLTLPVATVLSLATVELMAAYWSGYLPFGIVTAGQFWGALFGSGSVFR